ncbi:MAG: hypothetical protein ACI9QL_004504, partial [Candidatus Omnitrophota bacterium]
MNTANQGSATYGYEYLEQSRQIAIVKAGDAHIVSNRFDSLGRLWEKHNYGANGAPGLPGTPISRYTYTIDDA